MYTPASPRERNGRRLPKWPLFVLLAAIAATIILLLRMRDAPHSDKKPDAAEAARRPVYKNRAVFDEPKGPGARAQAPKITGTVYDMEGHALAGVQINATTFAVAGNQSSTAGGAASDERGRFELSLASGTYYVSGVKERYSPVMVIAHSGDDVGMVLQKGGSVTGHVYNERKEPVTHFAIDIIPPLPDDMAAPAPYISKRFDSPDGSFRIDGVPDLGVFVRATASELSPAVSEMLNIPSGETQDVDLTLSNGCAMKGSVVDEDGSPLSGVFIDAELRRNAAVVGNASVDASSQSESDAEGRFTLEHVSIGDVLVRAYDGTHAVSTATVKIESCAAIEPVKLQMSQGSVLTGVVRTADGKGVPGVKLSLSNRGLGFANTISDKEGRYRFEQLPAGPMRIQAIRGAQRSVALVPIPEGGSAERDIPFPATGTGEIRGRITANGTPLGGMQLMIVTNQGEGTLDQRQPVTAADGTYRVTDLREGLYAVLVTSTNRLGPAKVEAGGVATVDLDVAVKPEAPTVKIPSRSEQAPQGNEQAPSDEGPR